MASEGEDAVRRVLGWVVAFACLAGAPYLGRTARLLYTTVQRR